MDTEDGPIGIRLRGPKSAMSPLLPEVDCYLHLLVLLHLLDVENKDEAAVECSVEGCQLAGIVSRVSLRGEG